MSEKTYRIGEAAAKLNLKTYVLRFWEMEFPQIAPIRTEKGQRLYTEHDLALLRRIRYLLHERGLTIEGARRILREEAARGVEYRDAEIAMPEEAEDIPVRDEADGNESESDSAAAINVPDASDPAEKNAEAAAPGNVPEQVSLFPDPAAREDTGTLPVEDVRHFVAELEDIRRLLVKGGSEEGIP